MSRETDLGRQLAATLADGVRGRLVQDPWLALPELFDLTVVEIDEQVGGGCGLDGTLDRRTRLVRVQVRSSRRRMAFTLLHELGHLLLREHEDCVLHLAEVMQRRRRTDSAEEEIADAFAAEVLIPTTVSGPILGSGTVRARSVKDLFRHCPASRSACARRAAEQCPGSGYVVVAGGPQIIYAAPFGEQTTYRVRRGTVQPPGSVLAEAAARSVLQTKGALYFPSGKCGPAFNVDAVTEAGYTFAVFTNQRFPGAWTPPVETREWTPPEVSCLVCGEVAPTSWERCPRCGAFVCAECHACPKCRRTQAKPKERQCPGCFQTRPESSFPNGQELCIDLCS